MTRAFNNNIYSESESTYSRLNKENNNNFYQNNTYSRLSSNHNKKYKLPDDWEELFDEESGNYYYACHTTKHTQWLHPCIPIGTMMDNGLPYGWDYKIDKKTNTKYYVNHIGRFTTWQPPIKQRKYKGKDYIWESNL